VTGDNPLTDPEVLDDMVRHHLAERAEYTYTPDPPRGTRSEIIAAPVVRRLLAEAEDPDSSEYMTNMLRRPDVFRVVEHRVSLEAWRRPDYRLTVDTADDLRLVREIYAAFDGRDDVRLAEITALLDGRSDLVAINAGLEPKNPEGWVNTRLKSDRA
jgi:spore coat polysaccharide biosynthesis protein SpsF (cytidylyltransferase family)